MAGTYSHTTFQTLVDQLAQELNDPGKVFFVDTELRLNLQETLRVWNILTGYSRDSAHFTTVAGQAFYDLESQLPSQLARSVTVNDILGVTQYRLMEPYDPIASAGMSEMFTHSAFVRSIQQRQNRFLAETQQQVTIKPAIPVNAGDGVVALDDTTITIVRAVWKSSDGRYYNLTSPSDETSATSFIPSWRQSASVPRTYSIVNQPNLVLQLIPPPITSGELQLMTIETGANLDTTALPNGTTLSIMDDSSWGLGWGATEDLLLRDGIGSDPPRAQFAGKMYSLCVELTKSLPIVLGVTINDVMYEPSSLQMLDTMRPSWQGANYDAPRTAALIGGNQLALYPTPDDAYDIGVYVVRRTPIPAVGDYVQLGREQLAAIIAWTKQLCLFKKQGTQLASGIQSANELITQAKIYNEDRIRRSTYLCETYGLSLDAPWKPIREEQQRLGGSDGSDTADSRNPMSSSSSSATYRPIRKRLGGR